MWAAAQHQTVAASRAGRAEMPTMEKPMTIAPLLAIAALCFTVALVDRMKERASQDRFSFYDPSTTTLVAN
jgi:hypothetical protein